MNIRFEAVDENGVGIEDDDATLHPPLDQAYCDNIPRTGEKIMFFNTKGTLNDWTVANVVWMIDASHGYVHVCVQIRRQLEEREA